MSIVMVPIPWIASTAFVTILFIIDKICKYDNEDAHHQFYTQIGCLSLATVHISYLPV